MADKGLIYGLMAVTALGIGIVSYMGFTAYQDFQNDNKEATVRLEQRNTEYLKSKSELDTKVNEFIKGLKDIKH